MSQFVLVDGSSYLYRAYHALPELTTPAGEPTGAIYGVLAMLRRLQAEYKPKLLAVVFDAPGPTFRNGLYVDYKANRPSMPDDLASQIEPLHTAIAYHGWPLIVQAGVEADDVIGTLARSASNAGMSTLISTGDKDLAQLVDDKVSLVNTMSNETLDTEGVITKFGVEPQRMVDYLALVGDASDNIPGVPKCGPKTAQKWLAAYGDLDGVIAHAAEIDGVAGENLRAHLEFLPLGKELVSICCEVPLPRELSEPHLLLARPRDNAALESFYERYHFQTWRRELAQGSDGADRSKKVRASSEIPTSETSTSISATASTTANIAGDAPLCRLPREHYQNVLDWALFEQWLDKITQAPLVALDTETNSLDPLSARLVGISLAVALDETSDGTPDATCACVAACYIPLTHSAPGSTPQLPTDEVLARLKPWLESPEKTKVGQNLKYDQHVLANHGIALRGVAHDTLLQSCVLESNRRRDMDQLAARHLKVATVPYAELCGKGAKRIGFEQVEIAQAGDYAAEDADVTLRLCHVLQPQLVAEPALERLYHDVEMPVREVLFDMERTGVHIDVAALQAYSHELGQTLLQLEEESCALAKRPFNPGSPQQLVQVLQEQGVLLKKKTPGGAFSTDEGVLAELALDYPLPRLLLRHRSLAKLKHTYADTLPRMRNPATGRVHTHFGQATVATGRLSSSEPNLQNIPIRTQEGRRIRAAFKAPPGRVIVSADYSQIELRIMAHLSGDEGLLHAFAQRADIHRATAAEVFGVPPEEVDAEHRRIAKSINFGLIYGMSAFGLARQLDLERSAAQGYIDRYFARYPGVARYMNETRERARNQGYVETLLGRRLYFPEIHGRNQARRQGAERAAINAPMQGTAADLIKLAMIAVANWLQAEQLQSSLLLQVHDELVLEVPDAELSRVLEELPRRMGGVCDLRVPLIVEVGSGANWDEAH